MKNNSLKILISIFILPLSLLMLAACQPLKSTTANPTAPFLTQTPDDLEPTDEAWNYRANVFINGASNPWPEVQTVNVTLKNDAGEIIINYRKVIESQSG
jgi:uncharacterized lipoprotein YajG